MRIVKGQAPTKMLSPSIDVDAITGRIGSGDFDVSMIMNMTTRTYIRALLSFEEAMVLRDELDKAIRASAGDRFAEKHLAFEVKKRKRKV